MDTVALTSAVVEQDLYRRMSFIRHFEKKCIELSRGEDPAAVGSIHLCAGQEAIPVGALSALGPEDRVVATYRGHGWALEIGLSPFEVMAEICHREAGLNGGRAGSALMMAPERRFIGENSIVGAGGPIANGVGLALQMQCRNGVVVVSFGDGAMSQGALHEAMVFATMKKLPVIFVCENNHWSELTPISRVVPFERLARRANGYGMPGATVDGCDPVRVKEAIRVARKRALEGEGPSLIECDTVRLWGHYNRDMEHYRPKDDRKDAQARDPIVLMRRKLIAEHQIFESALDQIDDEIQGVIEEVAARVVTSAHPNPHTARDHIVEAPGMPVAAQWDAGNDIEVTYQRAVNLALRAELEARSEVIVFGEDVGNSGGIFGCSRDLQKQFGEGRVFDTPIAEAAILGAAVGSAMAGMRPVAEIMWMDFLMVAMDQLVNQASNTRYITQGRITLPMVVRVQQGATPGSCAQHSQSLEAFLAHIPGIKVGLPATPEDAYDMLRAAIADPDPCVIIEARGLYQTKGTVTSTRTAVGTARMRRQGSELTIVTWGSMANTALEAAQALSAENIDISVLDLRWLNPLDKKALMASVGQTNGRALVVHEANITGGFGAEIIAQLHEAGFVHIQRLGTLDTRIPASPVLQSAVLPSVEFIKEAVRKMLLPKYVA